MDHIAPAGGVTNPDTRLRPNGCALDPGRYIERPNLDQRIAAAGADPAAIRRMLAATGAVIAR